jgi:hypothetical protein
VRALLQVLQTRISVSRGGPTTPSWLIPSMRRPQPCIRVLQFHRGFPITRARFEDSSPLDIQQAAVDFPDMSFAIHPLALPYFEETVYIAALS